mgnify:CR=1 FL=1
MIEKELEELLNHWIENYTNNGDSHYSDTPDWKIRDVYWDKIVSRVLEDVDIEMSDDDEEYLCDLLSEL